MTTNNNSNRLTWSQKILYGLTNWVLFVAGIMNLGIGTWAAGHFNVAIGATCLTAGLILLFASTIDRFESLKGMGVEAKTRQLDQKIEQADETIKRLRELAELSGEALIANNARAGRWDGAPKPTESYTLALNLRDTLEGLGSAETTIKKALHPWVHRTFLDLALIILQPLDTAIREEQRQIADQRNSYKSPIDPADPEYCRLNTRHTLLGEYLTRIKAVYKYDIEEFPDKLLRVLEGMELTDTQLLANVKAKVLNFFPSMVEFKKTYQLKDPDKWLAEIEPMFARE